jgi:putative Holliday junction resolvase
MRILCLDVGDKRIGIALSDPLEILASPLTIIERRDEETDIKSIIGLITAHKAGKLVVGLPVSLTGKISQQAEKVKAFTAGLAGSISVPLVFWDESLSTVTAQELLKHSSNRRKDKHKQDDAAAAAVILQSYLEENLPAQPLL